MTPLSKKAKQIIRVKSLLAFSGIVVASCILPAHAGYDVDTIRTQRSSPGYGTYVTTSTAGYITVAGTLIEDADDKNFDLKDAWGRTINVETSRFSRANAANKLQKGDLVRVYGEYKDNMLYATNIRTLSSNAVSLGTRVRYQSRYYTIGEMNTLTGTLVTDADDDEFEMRATNGVTYMIRTRTIPDAFGANKLQKGHRVRVYGYWIAEAGDNQPQFEAMNFRAL